MTLHRLFIAAIAALAFAGAAHAQTGRNRPTAATPRRRRPRRCSVPPGGFTPETAKGFFTQYCVTCHNQYAKIADMVLDTRDFEHIPADADIWERVVRKLNAGAMPPRGMPRPEPDVYKSMVVVAHDVARRRERDASESRPLVDPSA